MRDVNETRYHLLFGADDWTQCTAGEDEDGRKWDYIERDNKHVVQLQQEIFQFVARGTTATELTAEDRRGASRDAYGHWYWIDATQTRIMARWSRASGVTKFYPFAEAPQPAKRGAFTSKPIADLSKPERLSGLATMADGYLVAGLPESGQLLVIDLYSTDGEPLRLSLDGAIPFDLAARSDGGLLVLDRENAQVWLLDRHLQLEPYPETEEGGSLLFQPKDSLQRREKTNTSPSSFDLAAAATGDCTWTSGINDPVAIEALPDGSFWVLDNPAGTDESLLWRFFPDGSQPTQCIALDTDNLVDVGDDPLDLAQIRAHDIAYLPDTDSVGGLLFIVDDSGNQAYALAYDGMNLRIQREYYPLRNFNGTALHAIRDEGLVYYHQGERWQPIKRLPRRRFEERATVLLPYDRALDGKEPDCVWHRVCIDACIPPETGIMVETRCADTRDDLQWEAWVMQPTPYKRLGGSEIPYSNLWSDASLENDDTGTWETLLHGARGRYLQFRLTLFGNIRTTPMIRAMRVHYPRFSYLTEYLPDVYQQDAVSAQFVENFLANPEGIYTLIEGMIAQVQVLMDVRTVPGDTVDWLADWLGLAFDPGWTDYQRRLLIAQAPYFFTRRGTVPGMLQAILVAVYPELNAGILSGPDIFRDDIATQSTGVRIIESFYRRTFSAAAVGDATLWAESDAPTESDAAGAAFSANTLYVTTTTLNIRTEPVIADNIIRLASKGEGFTRLATSADGQWAQIALDSGVFGWASLASLSTINPLADGDDALRSVAGSLAHQFTVLLPSCISEETQQLVERVIELEKPAHTLCTVKQFWAMFRVGAVRVGFDTVLGEGGRIETFRLNQTALAEGMLDAAFPHSLTNRNVLSR